MTVLGTRGSMTISRPENMLFGGSTSCYLVQAGEDSIFLDAGSGLLNAPEALPRPPLILLSHLHLDHLLGLCMYSRLSQQDAETTLLVPAEDPEKAIDDLYRPPYWPLTLKAYRTHLYIEPLQLPLRWGEMTVEGMPGCHPGGCVVFKVRCGEKSLVYTGDFEHFEPDFSRLADFARGTDLLLYDGQYTPEEYPMRKGYGHSTAEKGVELKERCGAGRLLVVHHAPESSDTELLRREAALERAGVRYAREGEVIIL